MLEAVCIFQRILVSIPQSVASGEPHQNLLSNEASPHPRAGDLNLHVAVTSDDNTLPKGWHVCALPHPSSKRGGDSHRPRESGLHIVLEQKAGLSNLGFPKCWDYEISYFFFFYLERAPLRIKCRFTGRSSNHAFAEIYECFAQCFLFPYYYTQVCPICGPQAAGSPKQLWRHPNTPVDNNVMLQCQKVRHPWKYHPGCIHEH